MPNGQNMTSGLAPGPAPRMGWPWPALIILLAVILPRLAALGDFPHMDDGYHAFMAQYIHHSYAQGNGFPAEMSGFKLFNVLFAWVWSLPGNALVWLRLADLLFAAIAGWLFCALLVGVSKRKTLGLLLALAFLIGLNLPGAIDSGYKNSFSPAFACFFAALLLVRDARPGSQRWLWAGVLAATATLFRETFFFFPLLGCAALLYARQFRSLWLFVIGGAAGGLFIFAISALARGQFLEIFDYYLFYGKIYVPEAGRRLHKFMSNGVKAILVYWPLIALFLLALLASARLAAKRWFDGRSLFWIMAALLPLLEPFMKIGFLYHFSVCLPGLAGYCAWTANRASENKTEIKAGAWASAIAACCLAPLLALQFAKAPTTLAVFRAFPAQGWPAEIASQSTTLEAATKIKKLLPPGGTTASTGFAYFIFPASQTLPPTLALGDLSRTYIFSDYDPEKFRQRLAQAPPDLILLAKAIGDHSAIFRPELAAILEADPNYRLVDEVRQDLAKDYGWLGYDIYRREPETR